LEFSGVHVLARDALEFLKINDVIAVLNKHGLHHFARQFQDC
jgi:hypothetical protein